MSSAKVNASENTLQLELLITVSLRPMRNAPTTAPGMEPMPPNTAATKARRPGREPDSGTMEG